MSHALLSPSSASRWLHCTPSARLEAEFSDSAGEAAEEGTLAHAIADLMLRYYLGRIAKRKHAQELKELKQHRLYTADMLGHVENYVAYVLERFEEVKRACPDAEIKTEEQVDLTAYVPEGFGTRDVCIIYEGGAIMIDLKFGKGVPVSAVNNAQLRIYGLGTVEELEHFYRIDHIDLVIYQPRLDSISAEVLTVGELKAWGRDYVKPRAALAFEGAGEYAPSESACRFCRAKAVCKARAEANLELADRFDLQNPALLTLEDIAAILNRATELKKWVDDVSGHALEKALEGESVPGFKLVEGRSNRKVSDEKAALEALTAAGFEKADIVKPEELQGITALTGVLGKKKFDDLVGPFIVKPPGKPTLVHESDPRPVYSPAEIAFANIEAE